mgnify:CR=1 FL=1
MRHSGKDLSKVPFENSSLAENLLRFLQILDNMRIGNNAHYYAPGWSAISVFFRSNRNEHKDLLKSFDTNKKI